MSKKIVIDPGHGGSDPGAEGFGLKEKDINLNIALILRNKLAHFADVILTRSSDTFVKLSERTALANKIAADFFISIHVNAGKGTGFESYVYINTSAENEHLRNIIHQDMAAFYKQNGFIDRGMKKANFAVLRDSHMPSVLLENLFIDTQADAAKLKDPEFQAEIADAISEVLIKALNLRGPVPQPTPQPTSPPTQQPPPLPTQADHWANPYFQRLVKEGLVQNKHNLDSFVTWGEMSAVLTKLLDKLKI